jgi:ribulose-5-phosphate 4-epimerase/fuculose-1-phosphate aldolase
MSINLATVTPACSAAEWETRVSLAACYRLVAHYKMADFIYTHITAAVPGEKGHFLINPYGWLWEEITASSLVKIDCDGNKVGPSPYGVNKAGFVIHSAVHRAKEVACVIHTHTKAGMAVSALECGLLPISQIAMQYYGTIGYHDYEGIALELGERERIVADLGTNRALILRNHGLLTVGRSIAEAFHIMYYLNLACEVQVAALGMGEKVILPEESIRRKVARQNDDSLFDDNDIDLEWQAHLRRAERLDPGFRA